ncbi:MAG: hypothetical protein ACYSTT_10565 [Planctomycetota bacterium]|jgi:hypothetical protein
MRNKNYIAFAMGIGLFGVLAIWAVVSSHDQQKPEEMVYGSFSLPVAISRFEADGPNGTIKIKSEVKAELLPVGEYRVRYWKTERKDEQGNTWALSGQYYGQDNKFEIKAENQTKLDVGEPIIATVDARSAGSSYSFNQIIKGRGQEIIELTRNGSRPQPPKLHIKNEDGSYDRTFTFQYG